MLTETTFEAVTEAPAEDYLSDTEDTLAIVHKVKKVGISTPDRQHTGFFFGRPSVCDQSHRRDVRQGAFHRVLQG